MRRFKQTLEQARQGWQTTDAFLGLHETAARSKRERMKWKAQRTLNDQAYFMLMFAAFEDLISRRVEDVAKIHKDPKRPWRFRRIWGEIDAERLTFLSKAAILTEKGRSDFNRIHELYKQRNWIAHGNFAAVGPIAVPQVYAELLAFVPRLARS